MTSAAARPAPPGPRSTRDLVVDIVCLVLSAVVGLLLFAVEYYERQPPVGTSWQLRDTVDLVLGAVATTLIWWRRRAPATVALVLAPIAVFSVSATVALAISAFTVAVHRRFGTAAAVAGVQFATSMAYVLVNPQTEDWWVQAIWSAVFASAILAWGMFVRARRQLVLSLRDRADRAEAEQALQVASARAAERARIAREMHDVLAHRVSLVALHAGGLEMRPDLSPEEVRESAQLIRTTARQALEELRDVIGVLRGPVAEIEAPSAPQPTVRDVHRLVEDSQRAGERVVLDDALPPDAEVPGPIGRAAYRIVQEALTNVHKHAPGTATTVQVSGSPGAELVVAVRNRLPVGQVAELPGSGAGLVGLAERVSLAGGTLAHGPTPDGWFVVEARLRWPA